MFIKLTILNDVKIFRVKEIFKIIMSQLATIPVSDIRENEVALRAVDKEGEGYIGLRDSIRIQGILNPINVRPSAEVPGKYDLVDGLHRFTAAKEIGLNEVPAHILDINQGQVMIAQLMANVHKVETRPVEYSRQLLRIMSQNPAMTASELSSKLGKSPTWVSERLGLVKLHPDIAKLVDENKLNLSNAYPLSKLPHNEQVNLLDAALQMQPQEFGPTAEARRKEIQAAARQGREAKPAVFEPVPFLRKVSEIKDAFNDPTVVVEAADAAKVKNRNDAIKFVLAWILNLDPASAADQIEKHKIREEEKKRQLEVRRKEREEKKAAEAAQATAAISA